MKYKFLWFIGILLSCSSFADTEPRVTIDVVTQRLLQKHGMDSKILRSYIVLKEKSSRSDGKFLFEIAGTPCLQLLLDRDYWVLVSPEGTKKNDIISYMFNPKDEQSGLNITLGEDTHEITDDMLAKAPGFTKIVREEGVVAGSTIIWRRWSDANHLYSDCSILLPIQAASEEKKVKVVVCVTANSEARRQSVECCLSSLRLLESLKAKKEANQQPEPTRMGTDCAK